MTLTTDLINRPGSKQFKIQHARYNRNDTVVADRVVPLNGWVLFVIGHPAEEGWMVLMLPDREVKQIEEEPLSGKAQLEYDQWRQKLNDELFHNANKAARVVE